MKLFLLNPIKQLVSKSIFVGCSAFYLAVGVYLRQLASKAIY